MSQYFTFDGTTFHNKDAFKTLKVGTIEKEINSSFYLQVLVKDQDNIIIYKSDDYKIREEKYDTQNGYNNYSKHIDYIINTITNI
jgi:hypothetical protein